jgi:hypothetical protein
VVHGVKLALLTGEFGGLQGGAGIDQAVMLREMEADGSPHSIHPLLGPRHVGGGQDLLARPPLRRDLRV